MSRKDAFVMLDEVSFTYGKQKILDHINLSLKKGKSYALIGKSGVGKSTLLNLIAGFIQPNDGRVRISGQEFKKPRSSLCGGQHEESEVTGKARLRSRQTQRRRL